MAISESTINISYTSMSIRAPYIPPELLGCLLKDHFPMQSVDVDSIKEFDGYADRNYYFRGELKDSNIQATTTPASNTALCCKEFVVKFVNSKDSLNTSILEGIGELSEFLYNRSFDCPYPIAGTSKDVVVLKHSHLMSYLRRDKSMILKDESAGANTSGGEEAQYCIRLSLFVKGDIFGHGEHPSSLLYELGSYVGRMNKELKVCNVMYPSYTLYYCM